jgi:endonuclease YncB( thermonuclease family)
MGFPFPANHANLHAMLSRLFTATLAVLLLVVPASAVDRHKIIGQASVIDGDTIEIHGQRIRFHGIDAPESRQRCIGVKGISYACGQMAALALSDKIGRRTVFCEARDVDRYKRVVAVCKLSGVDLNAWLVSEGLAVAYRRFSTDYVSQEAAARQAKRGIWAGGFTEPSEWRRTEGR